MTIYKFLIYTMVFVGFVVFLLLLYNAVIALYQSIALFFRNCYYQMRDIGWKQTIRNMVVGFLNYFFSLILILFACLIIPICFLLFKDFSQQVVHGNLNTSQFIAKDLPIVANLVANFYIGMGDNVKSFFHRLVT